MFPNTSESYDEESKWMNFLMKDEELLKKYDIRNKVSNGIKNLDCKPIYNEKNLKTKKRSYGDQATDFHTRKIPKAGSNFIFWSTVLIDSVLKKR